MSEMMMIDLKAQQNYGALPYEKKILSFDVVFSDKEQTIETLEGPVQCFPGDAIVTGISGERWPVRPEKFHQKYQPLAPTNKGESGRYQSLPVRVLAIRLKTDLKLPLAGGAGVLQGKPGSWLVQYEDQSQSIIADDIFAATYVLQQHAVPLVIGVTDELDQQTLTQLTALSMLLPATPLRILRATTSGILEQYHFTQQQLSKIDSSISLESGRSADEQQAAILLKNCSLVLRSNQQQHPVQTILNDYSKGLPYWAAVASGTAQSGGNQNLHALPQPSPVLGKQEFQHLLSQLGRQASVSVKARRLTRWQALRQTLPDMAEIWRGLTLTSVEEKVRFKKLKVLSNQLQELNLFNTEVLAFEQQPSSAVGNIAPGNTTTERMHTIADALASRYQDAWQTLVYSTTRRIAQNGGLIYSWRHSRLQVFFQECLLRVRSLVSLGMIAAIAFAAYTELSGGCKENDPFAFTGCASATWEHYAGTIFLSIYLAALLIAFFRYGSAKRAESERKHQDYRLLAECLRVQQYWNYSGLRESVADALPTIDSEDNHWIKNALRAIYLQESDQNKTTASDALERVKEEFIEAQLRYHENILLKRRELAANYLSSRARIGLSCFILCVMLIAINTFSEAFLHIGIDGMAHHFLIIITLASLSFWAANKKVLDNFGLESEIRRAKAMVAAFKNVQVFLRAQASLQNDVNTDQITYAAILSIGRVFILDQANWHALHHERPVEAATGG